MAVLVLTYESELWTLRELLIDRHRNQTTELKIFNINEKTEQGIERSH